MTEKRTHSIEVLLSELEDAASTPIVPGELRAWCETAGDAFGELGFQWVRKEDELRSMFAQIENDDLALTPRVKRMREKRDDIAAEFIRLEQMFAKILKVEAVDPQASSEATSVGERLRQDLLQLVLRCRTLDKEATTWFIEASHRDRGTGD